MIFTLFFIGLVSQSGWQSEAAQTKDLPDITTFPITIQEQVETRPEVGVPPVLRPFPIPEVEAVLPELIVVNPCDACFEYMSDLIHQLTEPESVPEVEAHPMPEVGVLQPSPSAPSGVGVGPRPLGFVSL
ncbi:hypothetical protein NQ315_016620 [Exocentrus adspersus]|uniref:Uncharacterized protein n=1 Tax=Exocentrus adspersus TaxID=1586481 RepID=A0AAV8VPG7_9CUCU|nr:hypothetical protein NQ315_016620 [Exocentrus adspersus]